MGAKTYNLDVHGGLAGRVSSKWSVIHHNRMLDKWYKHHLISDAMIDGVFGGKAASQRAFGDSELTLPVLAA